MMFESPCRFWWRSVESLAILQVLGQQEFLNILRSVSAPVEITGANVTGLNTEHFEEKKKKSRLCYNKCNLC